MSALRVFRDKNWTNPSSASYFDLDENKTRDIDIKSHQSFHSMISEDKGVTILYQVVAEVKKSDNPWIVFRQEKQDDDSLVDAWQNLIFTTDNPCESFELTLILTANSLYTKLGWKAYSLHEAFKKPSESSRWYRAFVSACKAAEDSYRRNYSAREQAPRTITTLAYMMIVKPIVVLDGPLLAASLSKDEDIDIEEIKFAPFDFHYASSMYDREFYRVDVVKLDSLSEYLLLIEQLLEELGDWIEKRMKYPI